MKNEKWFELDVSQIEKKLKTNAASGISRKAARSRWSHNSRTLFVPHHRSSLRMSGELLADFSLILLLLASVIALFFGDFYSVASILAVVVINLSVSFMIYYRSQRTLESMESFFRPVARVIREGRLYNMDYRYIVAGDVVLLERGDVVCADIRLVTSNELAVSMRVSQDEYVYLEKMANGVIRINENDPKKYVNIVHAGSVIEKGSARGIVVATGGYTYLGAMTGGIMEKNRDSIPIELKKLKKFCSRFSMISLIAVLPFCIISFFLSQTQGAEVTLSTVFLTALALSASTLSQIAMTLCKVFYINNITKLVFSKDSAAIRSTDALDRLARADYLFILDGSTFSNGELSFEKAMTFDGEVNDYTSPSLTTRALSDSVGIYAMADKRSVSAGISESTEYEKGIASFCDLVKIDREALAIRYPKIYHNYVYDEIASDSVIYSEMGKEYSICVSYTSEVFSRCEEVALGASVRPIGRDGVARLTRCFHNYIAAGKRVMIFTVLDIQANVRRFVGMLIFDIGVDRDITKKVISLSRAGMKTIVFSGKSDISLPEFPDVLSELPCISCELLRKKELPVTYNFGKYMHYSDSNENDILSLIEYVKANKKKVAMLGFSDYAAEAIERSDVFISCAPIRPQITGYLYEEINSLTTDGGARDASCIQMVKGEADILIPRPNKGNGGLSSVILARKAGEAAYRNLKQFIRYLICTQFIRFCAVAVPMLFGSIALDARHVLFCSFILDFVAFFLFLRNNGVYADQKSRESWWSAGIKKQIVNEKILLVSALVASAVLVFLPRIFGFFSIGGQYWYEEGCAFSALIYLHLTAFFILRYGIPSEPKKLLKDIPLIIYLSCVALFLILVFAIEPIRPLFGLEMGNPFPYFLLSFVPSAVFAFIYYFWNYKLSMSRNRE